MKKVRVLSGLLTLALFLMIMGCDNIQKPDTAQSNTVADLIPTEYVQIGKAHNNMLNEYYNLLSESRSVTGNMAPEATEEIFNDFFWLTNNSQIIMLPNPNDDNELFNEATLISKLVDSSILDLYAVEYILYIENLLYNPLNTFEDMLNAIIAIEYQAIENLSTDAVTEVLAYAETAKASLKFWTLNYDVLTNTGNLGDTEVSTNSRGIISDLFNKYKQKIAMTAASDAAGAAAGCDRCYNIQRSRHKSCSSLWGCIFGGRI